MKVISKNYFIREKTAKKPIRGVLGMTCTDLHPDRFLTEEKRCGRKPSNRNWSVK